MPDFISGLLGAIIGAGASIVAVLVTASRQELADQRKWAREERREVYSVALRSLARASIVPIGISVERLERWYEELALVREALVTLQACVTELEKAPPIDLFLELLDVNDFVVTATEAAAMRDGPINEVGFVLLRVGRIRNALDDALACVARSAKHDLGQYSQSSSNHRHVRPTDSGLQQTPPSRSRHV